MLDTFNREKIVVDALNGVLESHAIDELPELVFLLFHHYPETYKELQVLINQQDKEKEIPALLRKR